MPTLKDTLQALPDHQRRNLMYAFEHDLEAFIRLDGDRYIGVNTSRVPYLVPDSVSGAWAAGRINKGQE